jgi:hypothetical protein
MFGFQPFAFTQAASGGGGGPTITLLASPTTLRSQVIAQPFSPTFAGTEVAGDLVFIMGLARTSTSYTNSIGGWTTLDGTAGGAGGTAAWYSLSYRLLTATDITNGFAEVDYGAAWPDGFWFGGTIHRSSGSWTGATIFRTDQSNVAPAVGSGSITSNGVALAVFESITSAAGNAYTGVDNGFTNFTQDRFPIGTRSSAATATKAVTAGVGLSATTATGGGSVDKYAMHIIFQ